MNDTPADQPTPPAVPQSDSLEESVLDLLHSFDPATALHELDLLDDQAPAPMRPIAEHDAPDNTRPA